MRAEPGRAFAREGSELRRSVAAAAMRIDEIIVEAERVAERIRAEAVADAERYLAERRREADWLADRQLAQLEAALDVFRAQLRVIKEQGPTTTRSIEEAFGAAPRGESEAESAGSPVETAPPQRLAGMVEYSGARAPDGHSPAVAAAGESRRNQLQAVAAGRERAIIRATQLAIAGSGRGQIADALRAEFGLDDPAAIVDEILGRS